MILPVPRHFEQGDVDWAMPKGVRCVVRTVPEPLQSGQTSGVVPGAQPVPLQSAHFSTRPTVTSFLQPAEAPAEAAAEEAREDVPEVAEVAEALEARAAEAGARVEGGVAVLVVLRALVVVGEDLVGLVDLLEALLAGLVARMQIGMVLLGELSICFFDLLGARALLQAEHLVVIAFVCHSVLTDR